MQEIVLKLITFTSTIIDRFDVSSVTIFQSLNRDKTLKVAPEKSNKMVKEANTLLRKTKKKLKGKQNIYYWKITGVKNEIVEIYEDDVHFNIPHGMPRYYRNMRRTIIQAII